MSSSAQARSDLSTAPRLPADPPMPPVAIGPLAVLAATLVAIVLGFGLLGDYGIFIDEFYYLACADHLDWGFVDHPPLAPAILWLVRALLGESALALRLPVALAGAATLVLTGLLARRLGGGTYAQSVAALAILMAPLPMLLFGFFSMNAFESLFWTACAYLLVLIEQDDEPRLWWLFGLVAGLGLLNKHTMVLFAFGLGVGLVMTRARRHLADRNLWIGLGIAALVFLPNLLWQVAHDWVTLDFYAGAGVKNVPTPPFEVLAMQILTMNPANLLLWGAALGALLWSPLWQRFRHLGWLAASLLVLAMVAQQSRPDRLAGMYPMLFAVGAVVIAERSRRSGWGWLVPTVPIAMVVVGLALLPIGVPVLGPAAMSDYVEAIGVVPQVEAGEGKTGELPQWWADRFGWRQLAEDIDGLVAGLAPEDRAEVAVFAPSYGQAGALEHYSESGVPIYSTHNTYHLWGPPKDPVTVALVIGNNAESLGELFAEVEWLQSHDCAWCIRWRDDMPIWLVREPHRPIAEVWPELRKLE